MLKHILEGSLGFSARLCFYWWLRNRNFLYMPSLFAENHSEMCHTPGVYPDSAKDMYPSWLKVYPAASLPWSVLFYSMLDHSKKLLSRINKEVLRFEVSGSVASLETST